MQLIHVVIVFVIGGSMSLLKFSLFFQYFDQREHFIRDEIESIKTRILYSKDQNITKDDIKRLYDLKFKLSIFEQIERELGFMFID